MNSTATHRDVRRRIELTGRQREVIELVARGYTNAEIGAALGISLDGAKWHVSEIIGKLAVSTREEAADYWRSRNAAGARFSRALHGLFAVGTIRWAAIGAGAVAGGVAVVFIVSAIGGGGDEPSLAPLPSPTTATETVTGSSPTVATQVPEATPGTPAPGDTESIEFAAYFLHGEDLVPTYREVPSTAAVGRAALEALFAGPGDDEEGIGLDTTIPDGVEVLGLNIEDGVATVDLSGNFEDGGGSLSMQLRLAQVVFTLTQFETVDAVVFELEGERVEAFGGEGVLLEDPVGRDYFEGVVQAILVDSPANGEQVTSPARITGTANTFEATFQLVLVDADGLIVAEEVVTATSGSGERGTFDVTLPFEVTVEGPGSIIVFEYSAQDGSQVNISETRVIFER